nr:hypothetical protein [Tanacetum cinerariifolium]
MYEVDELRAISSHMLGVSGVQIPENNLDNLHSITKDGTLEIMDPQELLGLDVLLSIGIGFPRGTIAVVVILVKGHTFPTNVKVHPVGCDPLALESKFTHVEKSTGVLETMFVKDVVLTSVFPDEGICSVNLIFLLLFFRVTAISLVPKSLMQGQGSRCIFPTFPIVLRPFKTLCFFNYALMIRQDYDITSSLRRGALQMMTLVVALFIPSPPLATLTRSPTVGVTEESLTLTSLLALFPTCLQRIAILEAELKATKILHRDIVVLFAKRIKKLECKLKTKKRKLVLSDSENEEEARQSQELEALLDLANAALHEPSHSTTPSKPVHPEQSSEQEISPTTLDDVLTLSQSKARARASTIIYKRLKKQQSSSGLDFTDATIFAGGLDSAGVVVSAGGADSASGLTFAGISVAGGPSIPVEPSSPIRDPVKGKAVATPSSPITAPIDKELADQHAAILEAERQELLEQELKQSLDAEQVNPDSLLAQRVAEEQERKSRASAAQSTQRQAELDRVALNLTNEEWIGLVDQVRANLTLSAKLLGVDVSEDTFSVRMIVYDKIQRAVDLATAKDHHQHLKRSGETLESSESKKLKSSHSTEQPAELQETTSVSAGVTIAAGDPIPAVTSVFAASSVPAGTPIAAGVSTTAGASGSASEATVLIIELLDSPLKDTSIPFDPETKEQDVPLRKSSRKKSIARRRTLPSPSKSKSAALPFDEDDPEAKFKKYLRQVSDDDEPAEPVSLALVSDIQTEAGDIIYMFVDKKYPLTPETIQRMLNHGLEIDRDPAGNDLTTAI